MKKSFKVLAVAAIASMTLVACNNNKTEATDTIDSTAAIEQVAEEQIIAEPAEVLDTTPVVEEKTTTTAKKIVKKEVKQEEVKQETNEVKKVDEAELAKKNANNISIEKKSNKDLRKRR